MNNNRLLIVSSYPKSIINFRGDLIKEFLKKGLEVHVASPNIFLHKHTVDKLKELGVFIHDFSLKRSNTNIFIEIKSLISLLRLVKKVKPDYFFAYTIKPVIWGSLIARYYNIKKKYCIITGLGYSFNDNDKYQNFFTKIIVKYLYKLALFSYKKIFFQNIDDQKLFFDLGIIKDNNKSIVINGSGVNKDFYYYSPINLKSKDVIINFLMVSRLLKDKGVYEFIEAAKTSLLRFNKINFILVGDIDDNPNSIKQDEVDLWQKKSIIEWIKYEEDIRKIIKDTHVFILPSYREGTPRSVLEAMSMGRTIITTDVPGCRETVIDGLNGYLIKHKSSSDIVNAISKIIKNPNSIIDMGKESRKIIEEKYDVNYINSKIISNMNLNVS